MKYLQNITDTVAIGETVMPWVDNFCLLSEVVGKGFSKGKPALIVKVGNSEVFVTEIV